MRIIVQEFGATAVVSPDTFISAIERVESAIAQNYGVVLVVSAAGRQGISYSADALLRVAMESSRISQEELDILLSYGDALSTIHISAVLRTRGHDVVVLKGKEAGIVTEVDEYGNPHIQELQPNRIQEALSRGQIVMVMGCQGGTPNGGVTKLGAGSCDTLAVTIAAVLSADYVEIFTDVEGIMTADPRIVGDARCLPNVTYLEIYHLAYHGAIIINPRALDIAMMHNIPIRVRSTQSSEVGTLISNQVKTMENSILFHQAVTGITHIPELTQIQLKGVGVNNFEVFSLLEKHRILVDSICTDRDQVTFTIQSSQVDHATKILYAEQLDVRTVLDCAKICATGIGIHNNPSFTSRILGTLLKREIDVLLSGGSYKVIWCLVRRSNMEEAVRALHLEFGLQSSARFTPNRTIKGVQTIMKDFQTTEVSR